MKVSTRAIHKSWNTSWTPTFCSALRIATTRFILSSALLLGSCTEADTTCAPQGRTLSSSGTWLLFGEESPEGGVWYTEERMENRVLLIAFVRFLPNYV